MEGGGWAALGVINGYQLYLFKDAIQGRMNHLKAPFKVGPARWLAPTLAVAFMVPLLLVNFKEYVTKDVPKQDPEKFLFARTQGIKGIFTIFGIFCLSVIK